MTRLVGAAPATAATRVNLRIPEGIYDKCKRARIVNRSGSPVTDSNPPEYTLWIFQGIAFVRF